jgi:hypothetical protein
MQSIIIFSWIHISSSSIKIVAKFMNSVVIMIFFIEGLIFVNEDIFVESAII